MAIGAINAAVSALNNTAGAGAASGVGSVNNIAATQNAGADFGSSIVKALDDVSKTQAKADGLAKQAAVGDLNDIHNYMIASTEASVATELTVAVRNKAVEAFNEIMRMQV